MESRSLLEEMTKLPFVVVKWPVVFQWVSDIPVTTIFLIVFSSIGYFPGLFNPLTFKLQSLIIVGLYLWFRRFRLNAYFLYRTWLPTLL